MCKNYTLINKAYSTNRIIKWFSSDQLAKQYYFTYPHAFKPKKCIPT